MGFLNKILGKSEKKSESSASDNISLTHIFISYGSKDMAVADRVCSFLESNNIKCWMAPRDVKPGTNYSEEIINGLKSANLVIFICSKDSYQSIYVKNELKVALENQRSIVTYKIDDVSVDRDWMYLLVDSPIVYANMDPLNQVYELLPVLREEFNSLGLYRVVDMSTFKEGKPSLEDALQGEDIGFSDGEEVSNEDEKIPHVDNVPFPAYGGDDAYAFVSYAHKDYKIVYGEIKRFHKQGLNIWYDEGIAPGNEWLAEIGEALSHASLFIVFISPSAVKSKYVRKEITYAINKDIPFIAIHIEKTQMPVQLDLALGDLQAILKYGMSDSEYYRRYTKAFNNHMKKHGIELRTVDDIDF